MHLVQLLLPLDADTAAVAHVRDELTERFGGLTAYMRAPAEGFWQSPGGATEHDRIAIVEVMAQIWDPEWWRSFRARLERRLGQAEIVVRAMPVERV